MSEQQKVNGNSKNEQLEQFRSKDEGHALTTNQGLKVSEDEFSLKPVTGGQPCWRIFIFGKK